MEAKLEHAFDLLFALDKSKESMALLCSLEYHKGLKRPQ
jgi:hypothetical protein